jgi:hypothetical protein
MPASRHFLDRQYGHDEDGNYFVQNGPQRVFVELAYTPWVLHLMAEGQLETHVGEAVDEVRSALIDDEGNLLLEIADGIALLSDRDLPRLRHCLHLPSGAPADDASVLAVIERQGQTRLTFAWAGSFVPVLRVQRCEVPARYAFVASPQPPMPRKSS